MENRHFKFSKEILQVLASGTEVIIEQPDGSHWHFSVENEDENKKD